MTAPIDEEARLFQLARAIDDQQLRREWLERECGGDAAIRARVERLLEADGGSEFPPQEDQGAVTALFSAAIEGPGAVLGPYRLVRVLGEGGMGIVFLAEQQSPIRRTVALKIIRPGMDTREIVARFEAERQALALMDHPNVARVLDAGISPSGRPFFVMEYIDGPAITKFANERQLHASQRLELFLSVCEAIQHAHRKGIIHRDIKPTNVLVTLVDDKPVPKVIDFGVAKAIAVPLTEQTLATAHGQFVGTLEYMSPEQVRFDPAAVDTRTDVYGLGVLLYELLTGVTPFDRHRLKSATLDVLQRIVCHEDPPRPSRRLMANPRSVDFNPRNRLQSTGVPSEQVAGRDSSEPVADSTPTGDANTSALRRMMERDLDWVVMKALEKDRDRRYDSAGGLAEDIRRFLNHEPVLATPPSAIYRFVKFYRRRRGMFLSCLAMGVAIISGTAIAGWQALRAHDAATTVAMLTEDLKREHHTAKLANLAVTREQNEKTEAITARTQLQKSLLSKEAILTQTSRMLADSQMQVRQSLIEDGLAAAEKKDYIAALRCYRAASLLGNVALPSRGALVRIGVCLEHIPRLVGYCLPEIRNDSRRRFRRAALDDRGKISPDGAFLLIGDGGVIHRDTGEPAQQLPFNLVPVATVFRNDGLLCAGFDSRRQLIHLFKGIGTNLGAKSDGIWIPHFEWIALAPDGKRFAIVRDANVAFYETDSGRQSTSAALHFGTWYPMMRFSPDGEILAVTNGLRSSRGQIFAASPNVALSDDLLAMKDAQAIAFSADTSRIAVIRSGKNIAIYDRSGRLVHQLPEDVISDFPCALAFSPSGEHLAVADGRRVLIIQVKDGRVHAHLRQEAPVRHLAYLDVDTLVTGTVKTCNFWSISERRMKNMSLALDQFISTLDVATDARLVAVSNDREILVWDRPTDGKLEIESPQRTSVVIPSVKRPTPVDAPSQPGGETEVKVTARRLSSLPPIPSLPTFTPLPPITPDLLPRASHNGKLVLRKCDKSGLCLVDAESGEVVNRAKPYASATDAEFSADDALFVTAGAEGMTLWDTASMHPIWSSFADGGVRVSLERCFFDNDESQIVGVLTDGRILCKKLPVPNLAFVDALIAITGDGKPMTNSDPVAYDPKLTPEQIAAKLDAWDRIRPGSVRNSPVWTAPPALRWPRIELRN